MPTKLKKAGHAQKRVRTPYSLPRPGVIHQASHSSVLPRYCVIYCRVSTPKQKLNGHGLESQEAGCRKYAAYLGYIVLEVFCDDITGGADQRHGFTDLLAYLDRWDIDTNGTLVVVFDELKRFARDLMIHFDNKSEIIDRGAKLESPGFEFEDTPEGRFREVIFAAQAELERHQNQRQVFSRMQARLEAGCWPFPAPPGYRFTSHPDHGRLITPEQPRAAMVKEALEGFASKRFVSQMDVERFLVNSGFYGVDPKKEKTAQRLTQIADMLRNVLYTGYVEYPAWEVGLRKGKHESLIDFRTFEEIQARLAIKKEMSPNRASRSELFDLRGHVLCSGCSKRLTGCITRNKYGKGYPYYYCAYKGCVWYGKTVARQRMHDQFVALLAQADAEPWKIEALCQMATTVAEGREAQIAAKRREAAVSLADIDRKIDDLVAKIEAASATAVIEALDRKVSELCRTRAKLEEDSRTAILASGQGMSEKALRTLFEQVRPVLESPSQSWLSAAPKLRKVIMRMVFPEPLVYDRKYGFRTPKKSLPYLISDSLGGVNCDLVDPGGITSELCCTESISEETTDWNEFWQCLREWRSLLAEVSDEAPRVDNTPSE